MTAEADDELRNPFLPDGGEDIGWPFVRGAGYDGHSPEVYLADHWPAAGPPVLWVRELGQGYSAFVAKGTRVYTQAQSLGGQYVYCLHADTGETVWRYRYGAPYQLAGIYPGPRATPTLAGKHVYFAAPNGTVGCLRAYTGDLVWSKNVVEEYKGDGGVGFGYACSPTVIDGKVLLPVGGSNASLVALDAMSGEEVWTTGSDPASYTPAFPITLAGRALVVGHMKNSLVICDRTTGELLFRRKLSHGYDEHSAWPIYDEPNLWLSGPFHAGSQLIELPRESDSKLTHVWNSSMLSNDIVSSVLVDGHVYGFDIFDVQAKTHRPSRGKFRCLELLTGKEKWSQGSGRPRRRARQREQTEPEVGQASIVAADGKLVLLNEVGELILLRATPERYHELARVSVLGGELTWTPPALHRGRVYVRNHSRAVCVYVGEPDLLQTTNALLIATDVPQTEYRDLATTLLAIEPEYAFDIPSQAWLWNWYLACVAILVASHAIAYCGGQLFSRWPSHSIQRALAFVGGAIGTTLLSRWTGEFFFTWPVCLYVVFDLVASVRREGKSTRKGSLEALRRRLPLVLFLLVCVAYFLLCRRLSLVFEWAFLAGFIGAMPLMWFRSRRSELRINPYLQTGLTAGCFTCFYAVGVAVLVAKY